MQEPSGELRTQPNPKWIRGVRAGVTLVDSQASLLVWELPYYPIWYFPTDDVAPELVTDGTAQVTDLDNHVRVSWDALDAWFEEDVEVFVHPRSPEVRVDALASSRRVRVRVDGTIVADSARPTVLFETGLPPRYYLPQADVRMDLLSPTGSSSACPYKGWARYWDVTVGGIIHPDLAWGYKTTLPESAPIAGLVCFYNEKVDLEIDGHLVDRPSTKFS